MIILDAETSGRDPERHCVLSIGAVCYENRNMFYQYCQIASYAQVDHAALEVNGFRAIDLTKPERITFHKLMQNFADWIQKQPERTLGGANIGTFDLPMIDRGMKHCGIEIKLGARVHDLHSVCAAHMMQRGLDVPKKRGRTDLTVNDIFRYVGLPPEPTPHHALTGAKMETEAFARLWHGRHYFREFEQHPIPEYCWTTIEPLLQEHDNK